MRVGLDKYMILKPCPFCGGNQAILNIEKRLDRSIEYYVSCGCGIVTIKFSKKRGWGYPKKQAIRTWNRRLQKYDR